MVPPQKRHVPLKAERGDSLLREPTEGLADNLTFPKGRGCNGGLQTIHIQPPNSPDSPLRVKSNEEEETIMDRMLVVVFR
jgi:hypothetical protein